MRTVGVGERRREAGETEGQEDFPRVQVSNYRYERDVGGEVVKGIINGILQGYIPMCPFLRRMSIAFTTFSKGSNDPKMLRSY